jgi:predicted dehydrogenase
VIEAVRRTKRIVQVGTQRRSFELFQEGKRIVDSGALGDVRLVNSWWLNHQVSLADRKLEGKLDWRQWLGTAPARELDPQRFFNWYFFWDYSGGLMIGQAAHVIDAIHWFMNSNHPIAVTCTAGRTNLLGAEVPETTCIAIEYPENYLAVLTLGYKAMHYAPINDQLKQFHGAKARLDMSREFYALYPESRELVMQPSAEKRQPGSFESATRAHIRNFIECVKTRRDPNATVEMGQSTNIVLCMAMESLRSGWRISWNAAARKMES